MISRCTMALNTTLFRLGQVSLLTAQESRIGQTELTVSGAGLERPLPDKKIKIYKCLGNCRVLRYIHTCMQTICMHSHLPGEDCGLIKSFAFCSWLATFGPCCSFPQRNRLSGSCQGSFGKSRGSKLSSLMEHHSPIMPLGGKIVQTSCSCHEEFSWSHKSAGMGEEVPLQPVVPSIPISFSPLLHPLAHPEASMLRIAEPLWASMLSEEEEEAERGGDKNCIFLRYPGSQK